MASGWNLWVWLECISVVIIIITFPYTVESHYNGHLGAKSSWFLYRGGLFTDQWHSKSS